MTLRPLLRTLDMPDDCSGRVRYVRRTLKLSAFASVLTLLALAYLPMNNVCSFACAWLCVFSTAVFALEFCRGNWRAGSFCVDHRLVQTYAVRVYTADDMPLDIPVAHKLRCVACKRMILR